MLVLAVCDVRSEPCRNVAPPPPSWFEQDFERTRLQAELHAKLRAFQKQGRKHQKIERERVKQSKQGPLVSEYTKQRLAERYGHTHTHTYATAHTQRQPHPHALPLARARAAKEKRLDLKSL